MSRPDAGATGPDQVGSGRALAMVCTGLGAAAALLWAGSVTVWFAGSAAGGPPIERTGAAVSAVPGGVALLALAGVAGVVATRGPGRRAVGLLLVVAGGAAAAVGIRALAAAPPDASTPAPLLTVAGAALLLAAGLFVLLGEPRMAHLGARYGADRRRPSALDPDRAAWQELDAGGDPTVDRGADPAEDGTNRAV